MGWGQFMPSSYRHFARDGDGDGQRDLFESLPDVFASVANYFRSEEHTSELQSLMRISYAVFCLKKKIQPNSNAPSPSLHTPHVPPVSQPTQIRRTTTNKSQHIK